MAAGAADVGIAAEVGRATVGAAYRNLGAALRPADAASGLPSEGLPAELRAGLSYQVEAWHLGAGGEFVQATGAPSHMTIGVQWWPSASLGLRAGTADLSDATGQLTLGLSAQYHGMGFDYAMAAHPVGLTHKVSLAYAFGPTAAEFAASRPVPEVEPVTVNAVTAAPTDLATTPKPAGSGLQNIAISDLVAQNVSAGDAAVITDLFRSELVKTNAFNVLERQSMEKVLAEHAFQQSGCTSEECAVKLGKLLNVQRMIVGSFGKLLSTYFVTVRVIQVETGKILYSDEAKGRDENELTAHLRELAIRLGKQNR